MPSFIALTDEAWAQIRHDYEHTDRPIADICAEHGISERTLGNRVRRWNWTPRRTPISRCGPPPAAAARIEAVATSPWPLGPRLRGNERGELAQPSEPTAHPAPHPAPLPSSGERERTECVVATSTATGAVPPPEIPPYGIGPGSQQSADADDPATIVPRLQGAVARVLPAIETNLAKLAAGPGHPREMEQAARALGSLTRTLRELTSLLSQQQAPATSKGDDYDDMPEDIDAFRDALARRIEAFVASREAEIPQRYEAAWQEFAAAGAAALTDAEPAGIRA